MRCTVVAGARDVVDIAHYTAVLRDAEFVIAVDSGAATCLESGRTPDLVVGDFDSLDETVASRLQDDDIEMLRFPTRKDDTDLDIALDEASRRGYGEVMLLGAIGNRLDHTIATLASIAWRPTLTVWVNESTVQVWSMSAEARTALTLEGIGTSVSVFALTDETMLTLDGFSYQLTRETIPAWSSLGVSNTLTSRQAHVTLHSGVALVISPAHDGKVCANHIQPHGTSV